MKTERFKQFNDKELELIRYGLRNCSLYDFQDDMGQATVMLLLEEIGGGAIPFIDSEIRTLMNQLKEGIMKE